MMVVGGLSFRGGRMGVKTSIMGGVLCEGIWKPQQRVLVGLGEDSSTHRVMTTLRIDMGDFEGNTAFAQYATFRILNSSTNYTLNVAGCSGNAGDALTYHTGRPFTTKDRDSDHQSNNCAVTFSGAWWYGGCHYSNLNGLYHAGSHTSSADGVNWYQWKGYHYSLRFSEMKLR